VRWTVNCSILFADLPLLERPAAARAAGFDAVEVWWPFGSPVPPDAEVDAFARAVEDAGVRLTGMNFAAGSLPDGDRGFVSVPGRTAEFRDSVDVAAALGRRLGTGVYNALYGNRVDGVDPAEQDALAAENLTFAATRVSGTVAVEPLSGVASYPLRSVADVLAVLDRVAAPNVGVLADLYHLAVNGENLATAIERHSGRFAHVQIADAPGRHEPGTGTIAFAEHLAALAAAGYRGHVGLEYLASTADPFAWLPVSDRSGVAA
jgi:hydroxypyruvate isomerase